MFVSELLLRCTYQSRELGGNCDCNGSTVLRWKHEILLKLVLKIYEENGIAKLHQPTVAKRLDGSRWHLARRRALVQTTFC